MSDNPTPPDSSVIERYEAAEVPYAITAIGPLSYDAKHNSVALKNVVQDVANAVEQAQGANTASSLREQLQQAASTVQPVQRPGSWCVLTDGQAWEALLLPEPFPSRTVEGHRYYVRPLIQAAVGHGAFLLLALAQGHVALYRIFGEQMQRVHVDDLPGSLTDVVGGEVDGGTLQHHINTPAGGQYHGQGKGEDDVDAEQAQFVRAVDKAINDDIALREEPLMVAAVEELAALYRRHSEHPNLMEAEIHLSPDQTREDELRQAALDAFENWRRQDTRQFLEELEEQHDHALWQAGDVVRAAQEGRIETLVAVTDDTLWGRFDAESWNVEEHGERRDDSDDLVDVAMRAAWRQGGRVRTLDRDAAADSSMKGPLAARLRY